MPAPADMRLPAARMPMSWIVTPASASAASAASEARSIVSLSGCLPNFVILIPRIHTSSAMSAHLQGLEAEADGLGTRRIGSDRERREPDLHAQLHVLGIGLDVDDVAPHRGAAAVDQAGHEGHRHAGSGEGYDRERAQLALGRDVDGREALGAAARRTRVAPVE